ncbi:MAG: citrate (Si)-synthase [bacterium]
MSNLKEKLHDKILGWRPRTHRLATEFANVIVDQVTMEQIIGGMRAVKCLVTDISYLDPNEGIRFRGYTIKETLEKLPKPPGKEIPYVEGLFYLLLTGDIPTDDEIKEVLDEFSKRHAVPDYVFTLLRAFPKETHPMTLFSAAVLALQSDSIFVKKYHEGVSKLEYWDSTYEDSLNLLAKLSSIAAFIYKLKYKDGTIIESDESLDFGSNFAKMMGFAEPYDEIARLFFILHSDHENGNVSAHAGHLVASSLSDPYLSISAMLNGLAGPLHGLANQEVLVWIQDVVNKMGGKIPNEEEMKKFVNDTLDAGHVIPGYGHAVLRKTDPRYEAQREYCLKYLPEYDLFNFVNTLYKVVPDILTAKGKAKNPWPNVDAHSGIIQWYYGLTEYDFYTVLFGVGRTFGVLANIIWDRALLYPLERPKSLTTDMLEHIAGIK